MKEKFVVYKMGYKIKILILQLLVGWGILLFVFSMYINRQNYPLALLTLIIGLSLQELYLRFKNCNYCMICNDSLETAEINSLYSVIQYQLHRTTKSIPLEAIKEIKIVEDLDELALIIVHDKQISTITVDVTCGKRNIESVAEYFISRGIIVQ